MTNCEVAVRLIPSPLSKSEEQRLLVTFGKSGRSKSGSSSWLQCDYVLTVRCRWLQWAAYSGVFRSHDRGSSSGPCAGTTFPQTLTSNKCTVVRPWNVPTRFFEANRAALQRRAALVPYTYTAARVAYDTGVGPLIPMYDP